MNANKHHIDSLDALKALVQHNRDFVRLGLTDADTLCDLCKPIPLGIVADVLSDWVFISMTIRVLTKEYPLTYLAGYSQSLGHYVLKHLVTAFQHDRVVIDGRELVVLYGEASDTVDVDVIHAQLAQWGIAENFGLVTRGRNQ